MQRLVQFSPIMLLAALFVTSDVHAYNGVSTKSYYVRTKNIDTYQEVNYNFKPVAKGADMKELCEASFPTSMIFTENSLFDDSVQIWHDASPSNSSWKLRSKYVFRTYINNYQTLMTGSFENKFKYKGVDHNFIYNFSEVDNKRNRTIKGIIWNKYCKIQYQKILLHRAVAN